MFIDPVDESSAAGLVAEMYAADESVMGYVPNYTKAFSLRPELYAAWAEMNRAIKSNLDLRIYELATLAAATELRSSYCSLAHGQVLASRFFTAEQVVDIVGNRRDSVLSDTEKAVMDFAAKVARDAGSITAQDVDALRDLDFDDGDIFDIAAAAAARSFFTKLLEAVGTRPDREFRRLGEEMLDALTVGRPLED